MLEENSCFEMTHPTQGCLNLLMACFFDSRNQGKQSRLCKLRNVNHSLGHSALLYTRLNFLLNWLYHLLTFSLLCVGSPVPAPALFHLPTPLQPSASVSLKHSLLSHICPFLPRLPHPLMQYNKLLFNAKRTCA